MSALRHPNHSQEPSEAQGLKGVTPNGDVVISDELVIALAERGLSFCRVGLRSFSIMAVELTSERQAQLADTQRISNEARQRCEGQ